MTIDNPAAASSSNKRVMVQMKAERRFKARRKIHAIGKRAQDGRIQVESFFVTRRDAERAARQRGIGYLIFSAYLPD